MRVQIKEQTLVFKDTEIGKKVQQLVVSGGFPVYLKNLLEKDLGENNDSEAMMKTIIEMLRSNGGTSELPKQVNKNSGETYVNTSNFSIEDLDDEDDELMTTESKGIAKDFVDKIRRMNN